MAKLEIIGFPISTYVRAVRMACEEKGVPYSFTPTEPGKGDVRKLHPYGKVPVMRHGKTDLFESLAIATYIDRKFAGKALFPAGAAAAAEAMKWISFVNGHVYPAVIGNYVLPYMLGGDKGPDRTAIDAIVPEIEKQVKLLDKALAGGGNLAGKGLSFADMNLLPIVHYLKMFPEGQKIFDKARNLKAWFERNTRRKSWKAVDQS